jgi:hypothetical protein
MKRLLQLTLIHLLALPVFSANYTVKAGGGGNYTTIGACISAMTGGDTCTVYAGTYNETPTLSAGTGSGTYNVLTVNSGDTVYVLGFTAASHTKINGFQIQNPSSPSSAPCVAIPTSSTDIYITNNTMYACGTTAMIHIASTPYPSYVYIQGNNLSWAASTSAAPNITYGIDAFGDHWLVEKNTISHAQLGIDHSGSYGVFRNNTYGPVYGTDPAGTLPELDCVPGLSSVVSIDGSGVATYSSGNQFTNEFPGTWVSIGGTHYTVASVASGTSMTLSGGPPTGSQTLSGGAGQNCHTDFWFSEPGSGSTKYNLLENNTITSSFGNDAKGILAQGDGCSGNCSNLIIRFNTHEHVGSATLDNTLASGTTGFNTVKVYNNTFADINNYGSGSQLYGIGENHSNYSTNSAELNNIFYYPFSLTSFNPYSFDSTSTGATYGYDLAYCTASPCNLYGHNYSASPLFSADPGNVVADPKFVSYAGNNFSLLPNSPAVGAGTYLTTVASGDSGSGTSLLVTDASYFQDGLGLNAAGVQADCVSVTTVTNHVCVTAVNYSTNTLTLASGISRSSGDSVWLYSNSSGTQVLFGVAPNIGAGFVQSTAPAGFFLSLDFPVTKR